MCVRRQGRAAHSSGFVKWFGRCTSESHAVASLSFFSISPSPPIPPVLTTRLTASSSSSLLRRPSLNVSSVFACNLRQRERALHFPCCCHSTERRLPTGDVLVHAWKSYYIVVVPRPPFSMASSSHHYQSHQGFCFAYRNQTTTTYLGLMFFRFLILGISNSS